MKLMFRCAAIAATLIVITALPARAALITDIKDCGLDPVGCSFQSGGTGADSSATGSFTQDVTFSLDRTLSLTVATTQSAELGQATRYITDWQLAIFSGVPPAPGTGTAAGPVTAIDVAEPPPGNGVAFQLLDFFAYLGPGTYFLQYTGTGGALASFNGQLDSVPGPIVGAGIPGMVFACGVILAWRRRRTRLREDLITI